MRLNFSTSLRGGINGKGIHVSGSGMIDEGIGLTEGLYDLHQMPDGFDPLLLGCMKVTGYPNACKEAQGVSNPFKGISYNYKRSLDFGKMGSLELTSDVRILDNNLTSDFTINGNIKTPEILSIEPLSESWTPKENSIEGFFRYGCRTKNGDVFYADAKSEYFIGKHLDKTLHRFIDLDVTKEQNGQVKIIQNVLLYENLLN